MRRRVRGVEPARVACPAIDVEAANQRENLARGAKHEADERLAPLWPDRAQHVVRADAGRLGTTNPP